MTRILIGLAGIVVILGLAFALSTNRRAIRLRVVGAAFALQAGIAVLVLYVPCGQGRAGSAVGRGRQPARLCQCRHRASCSATLASQSARGKNFAIQALPVIIFFAALVSILYYLGIMQLIVRWVGGGSNR